MDPGLCRPYAAQIPQNTGRAGKCIPEGSGPARAPNRPAASRRAGLSTGVIFQLEPLQQIIVLRVRADPEPVDFRPISKAESAAPDADTNCVYGLSLTDLLVLQAAMVGV